MPDPTKPIAFGDDMSAVTLFFQTVIGTLGWRLQECGVQYLPNPYGPMGDLILRSWHMQEADGSYAGVVEREAYWDRHGVLQTDYSWTPFTVDTFAGY
jgi:hypothetical protein